MKTNTAKGLFVIIALFAVSAFGLLAFRDGAFDANAFLACGVFVALLALSYFALTRLFAGLDCQLLIIVDALLTVGMVTQYRINPDIAYKQLIAIALGLFAMVLVMLVFRNTDRWNSKKLGLVLMVGSLLFLLVPLAIGKEQSGAKNWIDLGFFSLQPGEFVKLSLVFVMAIWLSGASKLSKLIPAGVFFVAAMGVLVLERDLGTALIYAGVFVAMYYAATGNIWVTLAGLGVGAGASVICYQLFAHVRVRVAAWQNPWASYYNEGYQIAQGLMAIASGGLFGMGLTLGSPKVIPAYHTDYIFAVICEEFGIIVGLCTVALYVLLAIRGVSIALKSADRFTGLIALGCTVMIALQTFIILGGIIKLIPLTGVTLPFVSYGGSSVMTGLVAVGLLQAVSLRNQRVKEGRE